MLPSMILAHLLGDYVFQTDRIAMWKARSLWGVLVHGGIVTLFTMLCALIISPAWWPYVLLIGIIHIIIDAGKLPIGKTDPTTALWGFLLDQALHMLVIVLTIYRTGWLGERAAETALGTWLQAQNRLSYLTAYIGPSMLAWMLTHFVVKGCGALSKSLPGRPGERYVGTLERMLIATAVLFGRYLLAPLIVAPRLLFDAPKFVVNGTSAEIEMERIGYLGELLVSVSIAVVAGLALKAAG